MGVGIVERYKRRSTHRRIISGYDGLLLKNDESYT